jgi:putative ABC transport system permease protein
VSFHLREWFQRLRETFQRRDRDTDEELRFHLEMAEEDALRRGQPVREARIRAGGVTQAAEAVRDQNAVGWLADVVRDSRYGLRLLRKSPQFAAAAILCLALGIGGVAAIFSVCDAVLIRPLPYADAGRLVMIWDFMGKTDVRSKHNPTPPEWIEWRRLNTVFTDLASSQPADVTLSGDGEPEQVPGRKVTWNFWSVLGAQPMLGRVFTQVEDEKSVHVVVISYGLWHRRFGGSADIVGRKISMNDEPYEVIGVMPRAFYFLPTRDIDLWIPASFPPWMRKNFTWHDANIVARLKPGITLEHARESMTALSLQVTAKDFRGPHSVQIYPLREEMTGKTQMALVVLLCAAAALLLIACVNLANLLMSRGAGRTREVAVRTALGAGRGRLISQFLSESLVLSGLGAAAGLALALPAMRLLEALVPEAMGVVRLSLDGRVLLVSAFAAIGAAVIFGLAPALRGSRIATQDGLRDGGRGSAGARSHWLQHGLIVLETSLAVMLLTCGGLLLQTFEHLRNTDLGLHSEKLLTFETPLFRYQDFHRRVAFLSAEVEKVRAIPGVISAGSINVIPFTDQASATFYRLEGQNDDAIPGQVALVRNVSRDYFATVGARLREGRSFSPWDQKSDSPVAIVNELFANRHFAGRVALGQKLQFGNLGKKGHWYTIIGVVKSIRESGVLEEAKPAVYRVHDQCDQVGDLRGAIVVRTAVDPASIISVVRQAIWSVDRNQPVARIRTLDEIIGGQLSTSSQSAALLGAFALLALLLASLGIYGVLSYAVTQRTQEIGVRMALGASSREIMLSFGKRGLGLTLVGLAVGLGLAAGAAHLLTALLYGFQPEYVATAALVSFILLAVAALACFIPAHRASRVDPVVALRNE